MSDPNPELQVEMIPINDIHILNPRSRSKRDFDQIVESISQVGLKRPITVSRSVTHSDKPYTLVCGQGRIEAFLMLGATEIPAIIEDVDEADSLIMSLVENIARRKHAPLEHLHALKQLKDKNYSRTEIASKTGLSYEYVKSVLQLLENGEERLLTAVEIGHIPLTVAMDIAAVKDEEAQEALTQAYESGQLRGKKLLVAKRILETRQRTGKSRPRRPRKSRSKSVSSQSLVRAYQREAERQRLLLKRAEITESRLLFITQALRTLMSDEYFENLLKAENLDTLPHPLADLLWDQKEPADA